MAPSFRFARLRRVGSAGAVLLTLLASAAQGADKKPAPAPPAKSAVLTP
jgi:hypothetical protein